MSNRIAHARLLRKSGKNIEARIALETASKLENGIRDLARYLLHLNGQIELTMRQIERRPPAQLTLGKYERSDGGLIAELRPASDRILRLLKEFQSEVRLLSTESNQRVNEPGRYGSAATAGPVNDLADTLSGILDLIARFVNSRR